MNIQLKDVDNVVFNGIDVSAVKFNDVLVWRKWEVIEYTGAVPVEITANGEPLIELLISGNMNQSGVPSPTTPIQPQECGERMGNLCPATDWEYGQYANGVWDTTTPNRVISPFFAVEEGKQYTITINNGTKLSWINLNYFDSNKQWLGNRSTLGMVQFSTASQSETTPNMPTGSAYMRVTVRAYNEVGNITINDIPTSDIAVNEGSTALPYEPYGYKLDISSGGENLFDYQTMALGVSGYYLNSSGEEISNAVWRISDYIPCDGKTFTIGKIGGGTPSICLYDANKNFVTGKSYNTGGAAVKEDITISSEIAAKYIRFSWYTNDDTATIMLNLGSTAKPYSPYNRTTTPVYLGEVETTRQVKELVLDGTEEWRSQYGGWVLSVAKQSGSYTVLSTHYIATLSASIDKSIYSNSTNVIIIFDSDYSTLNDFKAYLAQQYANGTPVCVWYVLATPTTGILNEPLRKIGTYADTLSVPQTIPTVEGENVVDVETTLKPSEVYIKYKGKS